MIDIEVKKLRHDKSHAIQASNNRKLCPTPHKIAFISSPILPFNIFLRSFPSDFICPMCASIALRLASFFFKTGFMPLRCPDINTSQQSTLCPL